MIQNQGNKNPKNHSCSFYFAKLKGKYKHNVTKGGVSLNQSSAQFPAASSERLKTNCRHPN